MLKSYFIKRASQPSTWLGIGVIVSAALTGGMSLTVGDIPTVLAAFGLIQIDER